MATLRSLLVDAMGGADGVRFWHTPGRVNLIGDHTDYQDGLCLPVAIDREVVVAYRHRTDERVTVRTLGTFEPLTSDWNADYQDRLCLPIAIDREVVVTFRARSDHRVIVRSTDLDGTVEVDAANPPDPLTVEPEWGRVVAAVVQVLAADHRPPVGIDATIASTVPVGSGLSSSAAVEVALAGALGDAAAWPLRGLPLALAAQEAEHAGTGVPCGVMDQIASVAGVADHAVLLDCRSLATRAIELPENVAIVVFHSGLPRTLATSAYAQRRAACEAAATRLGVPTLREATGAQVADDPIARHVVSENARVLAFVAALRETDLAAAGRLMIESHESLARDFDASTPELDLLVALAVEHGAFGARLTGAGFGGCVVALAPPDAVSTMVAAVGDHYRARTGLDALAFPVQAVDGAGPVAA